MEIKTFLFLRRSLFAKHGQTNTIVLVEVEVALTEFFLQLLDACLAPDTSGDGSGCDNMTTIVVVFNSASNAAENNNAKRKVQEDEKPADKRTKADDS